MVLLSPEPPLSRSRALVARLPVRYSLRALPGLSRYSEAQIYVRVKQNFLERRMSTYCGLHRTSANAAPARLRGDGELPGRRFGGKRSRPLGPQVGTEGEFDQVGQQARKLLSFAGEDGAGGEGDDAAEER